jgi:hypothetical protein
MADKTIAITSQNVGATAEAVVINRMNLKSDDSGDWSIGLSLTLANPERTEVEGIQVNERHKVNAQLTVTCAEIAAEASVAEEAVGSLTMDQMETAVTDIAVNKLLTAMGLSA